MLAIRFARVGRKKQPLYRVVVSEKAKDMYGNHLEILGTYNPNTKEVDLKDDRIKHWLDKGAQASSSVFNLLIKEKIVEGKAQKSVSISDKRKAKKEKSTEETKDAEPEGEAKTEGAPAEEVKSEVKEEKADEKPTEEVKEEKKEE
ncbi:30S ribosomal protein S16 [Candidatus Parcubacteria bacterium]|jgi:small subunit ribosomal protein S16|nr:30S ribosomal protein S16 [Candidatus Parcubacteria bacterium]